MQRNYANLQAYDIKENLCTCGNDATNTTVKHESVQCTSSKVKHCSSATNRIPLLQSELCSSHGTVTGPGSLQTAVSDLHASTDTSFIPTTNFQTIGNHQVCYLSLKLCNSFMKDIPYCAILIPLQCLISPKILMHEW